MEPVRITFASTPEDYARTPFNRLMLKIPPSYVILVTAILVVVL